MMVGVYGGASHIMAGQEAEKEGLKPGIFLKPSKVCS